MNLSKSPFRYTDSSNQGELRRKRRNKEPPSLHVLLDRTTDELVSGVWFAKGKQVIHEALAEFAHCTKIRMLCLGLGSPMSSRDARAQLAFLILLCDSLNISHEEISIYDPVFTADDLSLLVTLKFQILNENKHAKYEIEVPTILYMPHCDIYLYENILRENWSQDKLPNLFFIANQFQEYVDNNPTHKLAIQAPCLSRLAPLLHSQPLPMCSHFKTAFNNISSQFVRRTDLRDSEILTPEPRSSGTEQSEPGLR